MNPEASDCCKAGNGYSGQAAGHLCCDPVCDESLSLTTLGTQVDMVESRLQGLSDLGLTAEAVADMLLRSPTLLGYQSAQLQAMREDLGGLPGLSCADVASLLQKEPRILSYSCAGMIGDFSYALPCMCPQQLPAETSLMCL